MNDDGQFVHIPGDRQRWDLDLRRADVLLLIGSQLAYGSVGTNASAPVLTSAGLRVATVPTILLSNLPHHPSVHALEISPEWLGHVLTDLADLTVTDEIDTVSTGYFADPRQVEVVAEFLADLVVTPHDHTALSHDRAPGSAKGTGDVFTAALISALHDEYPIVDAAQRAAAVVRDRIERRSL